MVAHPSERGALPGLLWCAHDTQFLFALQPKSLEQLPGNFILGAVEATNSPALMLHNPARLVLCLAPCDVLVLALLAAGMVWMHQHRFGPKLVQGAPGCNANDDVATTTICSQGLQKKSYNDVSHHVQYFSRFALIYIIL